MTASITQPLSADTIVWQLDSAHTQVEFEVKHMMFAKVRGRFASLGGTLHLAADGDLGASRVDAVIQAGSIDTGHADRDTHLRSPDFLDVSAHPELRFASQSVVRAADESFSVIGDLTIRDVTRTVTLSARETGRGVDPWGNQRVGFTATTLIDRRDFGLTWNQALETGGILVGTGVRITIEVQAVRASS
jgi:polyisoprenoid-binding protein YceI